MIRSLAFVTLTLGTLSVAASAQEPSGTPAPPVLHPGDRATVSVWRNGELTGTFEVGADSALVHPLYQEVRVAGIPIAEAEARVHRFLERFEGDPRFLFRPEYRVYVGGAVRDQNQHYLPPMTVAQAVTRAGGSTTPDRDYRLRLIRGGEDRAVALDDPQVAELLQEPIRSGDQILVEERAGFTRRYLAPAMQAIQTVTALVSTYVFFRAVLNENPEPGQ